MRIFVFLFALFIPFQVMAAGACYQANQYTAEQVVRFQTQLMVIAMMCDPHTERELYGDYQKFSQANQSFIQGNEKELLHFFQNDKSKSSEKSLHTLRTQIANEIAQYASAHVPSKFCRKFESRIDEAVNLQPDDLTVLVKGMGTELPSMYPLCTSN